MGADHVGGTDDGTQVMGIFNVIQQDEERILVLFPGLAEQVFYLRVGIGCQIGDHALMIAGIGNLIQTLAGHEFNGGAPLGRFPFYGQDLSFLAAFKQEEPVDSPAGAECLDDRVPAFDLGLVDRFLRLQLFHFIDFRHGSAFCFLFPLHSLAVIFNAGFLHALPHAGPDHLTSCFLARNVLSAAGLFTGNNLPAACFLAAALSGRADTQAFFTGGTFDSSAANIFLLHGPAACTCPYFFFSFFFLSCFTHKYRVVSLFRPGRSRQSPAAAQLFALLVFLPSSIALIPKASSSRIRSFLSCRYR